jgi:hypothetical protein
MRQRRSRGFREALVAGLAFVAGCGGTETDPSRVLSADTIMLGPSPSLGGLERPAVEFEHDRHVRALPAEGCATCHPRGERGGLSPRFARLDDAGSDRPILMNLYHERCTGCHAARSRRGEKSGPTTCGECHVRRDPGNCASTAERPKGASRRNCARQEMRWTYEIHATHVKAEHRRCDGCHHVKDPASGRPVYRKGAEEGCRACHGATRHGKLRSLREAAHASCISCHLDRVKDKQRGGPTTCAGCHSPRRAEAGAGTADRLVRGQPDRTFIRAAGGKAAGVAFDHRGHEPRAAFCATCHHLSLAPCRTCHTLAGAPKGGGVALEAAYHRASSERSCAGCHASAARKSDCAGCHDALGGAPRERACRRCHLERDPSSSPASSRPAVELAALPAASAAFPETVTIKSLAREYKPSTVAHRKIVAHLDRAIRQSKLARHFHGTVETLCAGCHHHSPADARPPACASCHGKEADPGKDRPGLKAAYHRQCMGCHQQMGIAKLGCTDCHAREERR